ncbi:MAG: sulfoxide reductase heme-binding subunit YedZ, partial [Hyphomicrobiales bacterium]|nr:sulfoxide reductase heme-binding subunit YedZ [Hyphomicrobiales bacterium]
WEAWRRYSWSMNALAMTGWLPWYDRRGRMSPLRLAVFLLACAPAMWMAYKWFGGLLSPKPVTDIIRESGDWTIRFLLITLAVTPLRGLTRWNGVLAVRRMLGLSALFYGLTHLTFYFIDQHFVLWRIALEIVLRTYLTIGFFSLFIMAVMGATSSDGMVRRLGADKWRRIHWWVYVAVFGGMLHFFMQVRIKAYEPSLLTGVCILLGGYRLAQRRSRDVSYWRLGLLALLAFAGSALMEAGYYAISMNAPMLVVLQANLDFSYEIRPAYWVLAAGLLLMVVKAAVQLRNRFAGRNRTAPAPA